MGKPDVKKLESFFGKDSIGNTVIERAMTSTRLFVRDQDHLALQKAGAKGLVLTAFDVYTIFGLEILEEVFDKGSAIIVKYSKEPAMSIILRREKTGWTQEKMAYNAGVTLEQVQDAENPNTRTDMHILCKICLAMKVDPRKISWECFA